MQATITVVPMLYKSNGNHDPYNIFDILIIVIVNAPTPIDPFLYFYFEYH